jgi:hypothetical protein
MGLKEIGCEGVVCFQLAEYRAQWQVLMNTVMNNWFFIKGREFIVYQLLKKESATWS